MMPRLYILLPVHNRKEITRRFVMLLKKQTCQDFQLILIDDGSSDGTAESVIELLPTAKVVQGDGNLWWGGGLQRGLDHLASCNLHHNPLILFINDDVSFAPDYLERAKTEMAGRHGVLLLSQFMDDEGRASETGIHADLDALSFEVATSSNQINCLSTRGLFAHWDDVRMIGGFRPKLLPHYLSDYEFTMRAHAMGLQCATSDQVLLRPDLQATGVRAVSSYSFGAYVRTLFSKRYAMNPWYWTVFVCLTGNIRNIPRNIARIWWNALRNLLRAARVGKKCQPQ